MNSIALKKISVAFLLLVSANAGFSQEKAKWDFSDSEYSFTRGKGFVVRPELYSGLAVEAGYQFNPYFTLSAGAGLGVGGEETFSDFFTLGIRAYTSEYLWAAFFDYHFAAIDDPYLRYLRHTLVGGASYKDLDFGAGFLYITDIDSGNGGIGFSLTIGYNIRCYKHR